MSYSKRIQNLTLYILSQYIYKKHTGYIQKLCKYKTFITNMHISPFLIYIYFFKNFIYSSIRYKRKYNNFWR